jgi:hypothetical protein
MRSYRDSRGMNNENTRQQEEHDDMMDDYPGHSFNHFEQAHGGYVPEQSAPADGEGNVWKHGCRRGFYLTFWRKFRCRTRVGVLLLCRQYIYVLPAVALFHPPIPLIYPHGWQLYTSITLAVS